MHIKILFSKLDILLPSDLNDNILSEITSADALVLAGTFSVKFSFIWISTTEDFDFFLLADIEREKRVKCLVVARCYVGLGYQFIHTKKFNSKQDCITIHPRKFLVDERQIVINRRVSI